MSQARHNFEIMVVLTRIHEEVTYAQDQNWYLICNCQFLPFFFFFFPGRVVDISKCVLAPDFSDLNLC